MKNEARTEVADPPTDVVTPAPWYFTLALWVPAFCVVVWFMMRLFGGRFPDDPPVDPPAPPH